MRKDLNKLSINSVVSFKALGECCFLQKGQTPIQKAIPGIYPLVVTAEERKTSDTYQFDRPTVCVPLISSRGHGVASINKIYYQENEFALGNILCGLTPKDENILSAKFLYYYLNYKKDTLIVPLMRGGANVSLSVSTLSKIKIPIPPMEIQTEIVRILDTFTEYNTELNNELTSRKKQYEYYREKLLLTNNLFNKVKVKNLSKTSFWLMPSTPHYQENGIPYITSKNIKSGDICLEKVSYISEEDFNNISKNRPIENGDILITMIGTIGEVAIVNTRTKFYGQNIYLIRLDNSKINKKFFYYYVTSTKVKKSLISKKNASIQGYIKAGSI